MRHPKTSYSKIQAYFLSNSRTRISRHSTIQKISNIIYKNQEVENYNPHDGWESAYHKNKVKLVLMILLYVYSNDDDQISHEELDLIKRFNEQESKYLTKEDHEDVYQLALKKTTFIDFLNYIDENGYPISMFNEACELAKTIIKKESQYVSILENLILNFKAYKS